MSRQMRSRAAPAALIVVALLAVGCSQDDVDKVVAAQRSTQSRVAQKGMGVFVGGGSATAVREFEAWVGTKVTHAGAFFSQQSWDRFENASWLKVWQGSGYQLSLGLPMLVRNDGGTLRQGASGAYDGHFRRAAQQLVQYGQGNAILRLGWEFNGNWYPWEAKKDPQSFVAYWRRIVTTMRAVPGAQNLRFDWNPGIGPGHVPVEAYPGDQYVDFIGMDVYDRSYNAQMADPARRWQKYLNGAFGLNWLRNFAASHNKPMSLPEWGVTDKHAGGVQPDNPVFIRGMSDFIRANNVAYQMYFEFDAPDGAHELRSGRFRRAAAMYQQLF